MTQVVSIPKLEIPIHRFELSCGAILLVSPRPGAPVVAAYAHMRGGPATDPIGREGSAYLVGALADQGTRRHGEEEIATLLEPAGGEVSGDASGISATIAGDDWPLLLELVAEMLCSPTYPASEFERQKKRLLDRLLLERDDPRARGGLLFRSLVYGEHWLGRAAYGSIESITHIQAKDLRSHHARQWVGRRAVISVCGDVDPRKVKRVLDRALRAWKKGDPLSTTKPTFPERSVRVGVFAAERQQVHVFLGHLGIERRDPDYAALVVMDHVLGTGPGFTNRISKRLRDELGLAYSVQASIHGSAGILPGTFTAYIGTSPEHVTTAIQGFRREIDRIQNELVGGDELDVAKSYLIGSFPLGFERASRRASYMVSHELHRFAPDNLEVLLAQFAAVTPDDVRRVARAHLHPSRACLAASGPVKRADLRRALEQPLA